MYSLLSSYGGRFLKKARKIMGAQLAALGMQAAGAAAQGLLGTGMGMLTARWQDKRQLRQQEKLQNLQIQGQKALTDYNMQKELEMWEKTGYGAQKEQMKKAGINPGLMYGMGGGGGQTASVAPGSVSGGNAPTGGGEIQAFTGMALQNALIDAQRRNIEADTENKKAEAAATAGVKTDIGKAQIESIMQDITESKAKTIGQNIQNELLALEAKLKGKTFEEAVDIIMWTAEKTRKELEILTDAQYVSHVTRNKRADTINAEYMTQLLQQAALKMGIVKTDAEIRKIAQEVNNMIQENMREWDKMGQKNQEILFDKIMQNHQMALDNDISRTILQSIPGVILPVAGKGRPTPVTGFGRGNN